MCGLLIVVASLGFSLDLVTLGAKASAVSAHGLSCTTACRIFLDQGSNWCPCIARQILNHWTTREALSVIFNFRFPSDFFFNGLQASGKILHLVICFLNVLIIIIYKAKLIAPISGSPVSLFLSFSKHCARPSLLHANSNLWHVGSPSLARD